MTYRITFRTGTPKEHIIRGIISVDFGGGCLHYNTFDGLTYSYAIDEILFAEMISQE